MNRVKATEMIFDLIPLLDKKFVKPFEHQFKPVLSPIQANVLSILKEKKATMTELSSEILILKQQMTPIIDKLVSQGFVQRKYDNTDRRIIKINITTSGLSTIEIFKEKIFAMLAEKIEHLDDQEVQRLINAISELQKIAGKLP
ncbi:MarR family winged helix-turn-helix transcriptional regulator [Sporomusa sp. KB1]|uniref:MarR family winged helix-turn-helix transcriptional regulator n=1 Tax=Sporomusa sp. KB1 TaxID=943346 RepID=UPI0011AC10FD|nr:MarR family transcriptional regulator [Sporomusa sp. KB1]TWH47390.1 DNA-binding MarR family transcriptional regulator [Sporomusa sp. KB1]